MGKTNYPPGVDGHQVVRETAEKLQTFLRRNGCGDEIAIPEDDDIITVTISGMGARALMTRWKDLTSESGSMV